MKRFKRIYVEITSACNLSCSICPGTSRNKSFMDPGAFDEILRKIRPFTDYLYLHVMGEPLVHPRFPEILDICDRHGFKVNVATNGVLIRKHMDALLKSKSVRQISFSIHCLEIQRNTEIPAGYLEDILEFIDEGRKKTKIIFAFRLWNMKPGTEPAPGLTTRIEKFFSLPQKIMDIKIEGKGIELAPRVFLNFGEEFAWPDQDSGLPEEKGFCRGLRDHCAILVDGTVVPCCLDKDAAIPLGNIFDYNLKFSRCRVVRPGQVVRELDAELSVPDKGEENSSPGRRTLHQIIEGERAEGIIKGFSEGRAVEKLCKTCGFRKRFNRFKD